MTLSRNAYVNVLRAENGYKEGRDPDGSWNNYQKFSPAVPGLEWSQNQAWCHTFVSWGAVVLGDSAAVPVTASCYTGNQWFKQRDRWSEYPVLGGLFYMGSSGQDHVGVVYAYDADNIYTVEGNTNAGGSYQGDGVYERIRPRRGTGSPFGYGAPFFAEPIVSADPKWGGTAAASVPKEETPPPTEGEEVALTDEMIASWNGMIWGLKNTTEDIQEKVNGIIAGSPVVDLNALADIVADKLAERLAE